MYQAVLTIDDAPTRITPRLVDYLRDKGITPVINFIGAAIQDHFEEAVYVAKAGIVIGNHSFMHPHFSELTLEEAREDITRAEAEINRVYQAAGIPRSHRVFRFPYGDKGGENAELLQGLLKELCFERLDSSTVTFPFWKKYHVDTDIDMMWTWDFIEYQLPWENDYTWDSIVKAAHDPAPKQGGALLSPDSTNIILIHDMESTEAYMPGYFEKLIDYVMSCQVTFVEPKFIK